MAFLTLAWSCLRSPAPDITPEFARQLTAVADRWWPSRGDYATHDVPRSSWPASIRQLAPKRVYVLDEGIYIELGSRFVEGWGIFLLPTDSPFRPSRVGDPSYRQLQGRVYWYEIKG